MSESRTAPRTLRIGTRGSRLARMQARWVADRLSRLGRPVEVVELATRGDADQTSRIGEIGSTGLFTKEIQRALLAGDVDLAVHSLKDLPTAPVEGLVLAAVPPRESAADVLVADATTTLESLPTQAVVGTGSLRRRAQLRHARPDLRVEPVRGNVETRLRRLDEGQVDALVLAEAGLVRLGLAERITQVLPWDVMLPAVGQGALGIECRTDDADAAAAVARLDDAASHAAVLAERSLLAHLRGGCLAPVGARARIEDDSLRLTAAVLSVDGRTRLDASGTAAPNEAVELGRRVAEWLVAQGAADLIAAAHHEERGAKSEERGR
jgi:hydroxymethylbilane synthase